MKLESQTFICDAENCRIKAVVYQTREQMAAQYLDLVQDHGWFVDKSAAHSWKHLCCEHRPNKGR